MKVDCPPDLPEINADPGMLRQALLNLALNALPGDARRRHAADRLPRRAAQARRDRSARTPASASRRRI